MLISDCEFTLSRFSVIPMILKFLWVTLGDHLRLESGKIRRRYLSEIKITFLYGLREFFFMVYNHIIKFRNVVELTVK